jgi:hypothetical protein
VAIDLITNVADQGFTEEEAVSNLKKGIEEALSGSTRASTQRKKTIFSRNRYTYN